MSLVRLHVRVSPHVLDDAADRAVESGLTPQRAIERVVAGLLLVAGSLSSVKLVVEDPTDPGAFSVLGTSGANKAAEIPDASILASEDVEEPPALAKANLPGLDDGLLTDEARAVALALIKDHDPDRLDGMAGCFAPDLPHVGALLFARARLENARRRGGKDHHEALRSYQDRVSRRARTGLSHVRRGISRTGVPLAAPESDDHAARIVEALRTATAPLGGAAASTWEGFAGAIELCLDEDPPVIAPPRGDHPAVVVPENTADVERTMGAVLSDPSGARMSALGLSNLIGVCPVVANAVLSSVVPLGGGVVLVRNGYPRVLYANKPPPSAAAIKLAASTIRPKSQGLADQDLIAPIFAELHGQGDRNDPPVAQVARARRAVARRNWVEWFRRAERSGILGAVR